MKSFLCALLLLCSPFMIVGQARLMTIEEASSMNPKLSPANLSQLQWMGDSKDFAWVAKNCLVSGSVSTTGRDTILRLDSLNASLTGWVKEPLKRFPSITFLGSKQFYFSSGNSYFLYDLATGKAKVLNTWDEKAENPDFDVSSNRIAFTRGNNLFISTGGKELKITDEKNPRILYGSSRVHRNEWGIGKGTFWSPKGNFLAFYRMDESMVAEYPLVDVTTRIATVTPAKYPMAGEKSHKVTLGVYNLLTGTTTYMNTDRSQIAHPISQLTDTASAIEFLTNVTWSPDERYIYIATLNRDQNVMNLNKYNALSGELVKTLFTEKSAKYIEPMNGPEFLNNDPSRFIWQSQQDGFNHLYYYTADGDLLKQLTKGPWVVTGLLGSDAGGHNIYFTCNKDNPTDRQVYAVDIKTGDLTRITRDAGYHNPKISSGAEYILDNFSSPSIPRKVELLDEKGTMKQSLLEAVNPLKELSLGETTVFTLKNKENSDLYCRLIKPAGFDPSKKYPVIVYVYGGPHSQLIINTWLSGAGLYLNYLAEQGYIVFTMDNRGTSNRGIEFEQITFRDLGTVETEDQMEGISYLRTLPWVDTTRFGIHGWSYGGFMALSMMLRNPGVFKVAVAGGPVVDWKYYEVMYGERYMDTPQTNPDGYKNASLLNYVKNLSGKLLIIQGYQDNVVVPQNCLSFIRKCVDENKQLDFFVYPGHEHGVGGKDRVHLNQKIFDYFRENL